MPETGTLESFDSCLDLRCSQIHLRVTPQLVAALHANSCVDVFASPQLPLFPAVSYPTAGFPGLPPGLDKQSVASSFTHDDAIPSRAGRDGNTGGAAEAFKGTTISGADHDDAAVLSALTGISEGPQPSASTSAEAGSVQLAADYSDLSGSPVGDAWKNNWFPCPQDSSTSKLRESVSITTRRLRAIRCSNAFQAFRFKSSLAS